MFAMLSALVFTGAAYFAVFAVASTFRDSRSRVADAIRGRPLPRVRPMLRAVA